MTALSKSQTKVRIFVACKQQKTDIIVSLEFFRLPFCKRDINNFLLLVVAIAKFQRENSYFEMLYKDTSMRSTY